MPCKPRGFCNVALRILGFCLSALTLFCPTCLPAQKTTQKHGEVKGTVLLVNASGQSSTSEGLLLELQSSIEVLASLSAVTDAEGNYKFLDVPDGDYVLQLKAEGFEPFTAIVHVRSGAPAVQNISVKLAGVTQKIEVRD